MMCAEMIGIFVWIKLSRVMIRYSGIANAIGGKILTKRIQNNETSPPVIFNRFRDRIYAVANPNAKAKNKDITVT